MERWAVKRIACSPQGVQGRATAMVEAGEVGEGVEEWHQWLNGWRRRRRAHARTYLVCVLAQRHGEGAGKAKVGQLQYAVPVHQHVLRLEVPVHDAAGVARFQAPEQLVQVRLQVGSAQGERVRVVTLRGTRGGG